MFAIALTFVKFNSLGLFSVRVVKITLIVTNPQPNFQFYAFKQPTCFLLILKIVFSITFFNTLP